MLLVEPPGYFASNLGPDLWVCVDELDECRPVETLGADLSYGRDVGRPGSTGQDGQFADEIAWPKFGEDDAFCAFDPR